MRLYPVLPQSLRLQEVTPCPSTVDWKSVHWFVRIARLSPVSGTTKGLTRSFGFRNARRCRNREASCAAVYPGAWRQAFVEIRNCNAGPATRIRSDLRDEDSSRPAVLERRGGESIALTWVLDLVKQVQRWNQGNCASGCCTNSGSGLGERAYVFQVAWRETAHIRKVGPQGLRARCSANLVTTATTTVGYPGERGSAAWRHDPPHGRCRDMFSLSRCRNASFLDDCDEKV